MIFGFNTDIKHEDTVYHVQSEARQHDLLLQTQVFVRGRCIGKHATSYADKVNEPGFSDEHMHEMLKTQHKSLIEAIRAGTIESMFDAPVHEHTHAAVPAAASAPAADGLTVQWLNADTVYHDNTVVMKFSVSRSGSQVPGARLTTRLHISTEETPIYSQAVTGPDGMVEMSVVVDENELIDAAILVQAAHDGQHATRKFKLRRTQ